MKKDEEEIPIYIMGTDKPHDSPVIHYLDTIGGGHLTNVPELVETLTKNAPSAIQRFENFGVMFDKEANGTMKVLHCGGTSRKRMHSAGDMRGAAIMQVLRNEIRNHPEIKVIKFSPAVELILDSNVGLLITEKMRGAGAQILNIEGEQFVYPLEPHDVESSAIIRECTERKKGIVTPTGRIGVWLDTPMIDILRCKGYIQENFPAKYRQLMSHNIDISKKPIPVFPTLHYQNGGIKINKNAETAIPNLFTAGKVTDGVHRTNRLMGNSLLDIIGFGRRVGVNAAKNAKKSKLGKLSLTHIKKYNQMVE